MLNKKVGIIGAGKLGTALALALKNKGIDLVGITCLTPELSKQVAQKLGVKAFANNFQLADSVDVLFITVPDQEIIAVAQELLDQDLRNQLALTVFHCSGAMSGYELPKGEQIVRGSFHPLQSFADGQSTFEGIYIAIDGEKAAVQTAKQLCDILSAKALDIPPKDRPLYHAVACMASNHLVTLLALAQETFSRWTGSLQTAQQALWPLVQGSLKNVEMLGAQKALTGPIARGDSQTIAQHLAVLPKDLDCFYKVMSLYTLKLAAKNGSLSPEQIQAISDILQQKESKNGDK